MSAPVTRMCSECARDFEVTPAPGRPPTRCPRCRRESNGNGTKPARTRAALAVVSDAPVPAAETVSPLDIPAMQAAVSAEIEQLEDAIVVRLRLQYALARVAALRLAVSA